jgi:hypothetical protein
MEVVSVETKEETLVDTAVEAEAAVVVIEEVDMEVRANHMVEVEVELLKAITKILNNRSVHI